MPPIPPGDTQAATLSGGVRLRRLLVAFDGSDSSAAASAFALWLAGKADAEAGLVHVCPELKYAPHAAYTAPPDALQAAAEQRLAAIADWRRRLDAFREYAAADASVESIVVRGQPAGALLDEAAARDIDLILMGSTGVGWTRGALLGSVSSQVIEHAPCSVMVFREGQTSSPAHVQSIVVGLDGSAGAADALGLAAQLAAPLGARLVLLHAYEPSIALAPPTPDIRAEDAMSPARSGHPRSGEARPASRRRGRRGTGRRAHTAALVAACEQHDRRAGRGWSRARRLQRAAPRRHVAVGAQPRTMPGPRRATATEQLRGPTGRHLGVLPRRSGVKLIAAGR